MAFGNVKSVEIVVIGFDLAVIFNAIAHRNEDVLDLLPQDRDQMEVPGSWPASWQRNVDPFSFDLCV